MCEGFDVVRNLAQGGATAGQRLPQSRLRPGQHRSPGPARKPQYSSGTNILSMPCSCFFLNSVSGLVIFRVVDPDWIRIQ
jgi:hypothetical protein